LGLLLDHRRRLTRRRWARGLRDQARLSVITLTTKITTVHDEVGMCRIAA